MSRIVVEFKGKITTIEGVPYVRIPVLTPSHVVEGDRMWATANAITVRANLLHVNDTFRPIAEVARLTHVSGEFIGTFRIDLGTHEAFKAARDTKDAIVSKWWDTSREDRTLSMMDMEEYAHASVLAVFATFDAIK